MFSGILGEITGFVGIVKAILIIGMAGAAAAAVGYFARSLIAGGSGLIVAVVAGALVAVGANSLMPKPKTEATILAEVRLAQEQAKLAALQHEKEALEEVLGVQHALENEAVREQERLAALVEDLQKSLEGRKEDCPEAATEDEMKAIGKIK